MQLNKESLKILMEILITRIEKFHGKIDINSAGYWMENWSLEDKMSEGLTFLENTFQIIDKTAGNKVLSPTEYTLIKTTAGFSVSFNSPLKEGTDHKYQIKYKTKFDTSVIDNGCWS